MPSVGSVTSNLNPVTKSGAGPHLASANDLVLVTASAAAVVTLPTAPTSNTLVGVRKVDSSANAVTVNPAAGATVNGTTSYVLPVQGSSATFQYNSATTDWIVRDADFLPPGGASGAVLTKNSPSNYDVKWATASGGSGGGALGFAWTAGRSYTATPIASSPLESSGHGGASPTFYPVRVPNACTVSSVSVLLGSNNASSGTMYMYMYSDVLPSASRGPGIRLAGGSAAFSANQNSPIAVSMGNYVFAAGQNIWLSYGSTGCQIKCLQYPYTNVVPDVLGAWYQPTIGIYAYAITLNSPTSTPSYNAADVSSSAASGTGSTSVPMPMFIFAIV